MLTKEQVQFGTILKALSEELDISDSRYKEAVNRYDSVTEYLSAPDSPLLQYSPDIYPQGSFRLGTVIKPVTDKDEFDIDLVCMLAIHEETITPNQLKAKVGNRLKQNGNYDGMREEKERCWRLNYANEFHIDILPAIPDRSDIEGGILIPDRTLDASEWCPTNPKGYAKWFYGRMADSFDKHKRILAESKGLNIESVPDWQVKTPLQRAVQILKRLRDIKFKGDDDKPASILITTLAAHEYNNEVDLFETINRIVMNMDKHIDLRGDEYWVPNPKNHQENLARKMKKYNPCSRKFFSWLNELKSDMQSFLQYRGMHIIAEQLRPHFGDDLVDRTIKRLGSETYAERKEGRLLFETGTGMLGTALGTPVKDHTFHGK